MFSSARIGFGVLWVALGLVIAFLHFLANAYYLYYLWWWADIVMHFLGGVFVALGILWFLLFELPKNIRERIPIFLTTLVLTIAVGAGWEVFERVFDAYSAVNYTLDTTLDLVMDVAGMLGAYLIVKRYV